MNLAIMMLSIYAIIATLTGHVVSFTTRSPRDFGDSSTVSPESMRLTEKYVRVTKKMEDYCGLPYNHADDKTIDMYTQCFSNLLRAVSNDLASDKC